MRSAAGLCAIFGIFIFFGLDASAQEASTQKAPEDSADACIAASDDAQKLRDDGHYLRARTSFITCAHEACPSQIRSDCLQWLDDLDKKTPTVVLSAKDSGKDVIDVKVTVDGVPLVDQLDGRPIALDPGEHRFRWSHGAEPTLEDVVVVRAGEKNRPISAKFGAEPVPVRPGPPALAFVLSGVGVAGVATFAILGLSGYGTYRSYRDCIEQGGSTTSCDKSGHESASVRDFIIGDSALVIGLASGAVATWLFLRHRDPVMVDQRVTAGVAPTSHGAAANLSIRF